MHATLKNPTHAEGGVEKNRNLLYFCQGKALSVYRPVLTKTASIATCKLMSSPVACVYQPVIQVNHVCSYPLIHFKWLLGPYTLRLGSHFRLELCKTDLPDGRHGICPVLQLCKVKWFECKFQDWIYIFQLKGLKKKVWEILKLLLPVENIAAEHLSINQVVQVILFCSQWVCNIHSDTQVIRNSKFK